MPGINMFNAMGGMSPMNAMYQNLSANRRQGQALPAADGTDQATQQAAAATARPASPQMPAPTQATALPTVENLDNASETLSQMRVQFSDPADAAFEQFQAESGSRMPGMGQMQPPAENGRLSAQGVGQMTPPPPSEGAFPAQSFDEQAAEGTAAPLAAVTSGVV